MQKEKILLQYLGKSFPDYKNTSRSSTSQVRYIPTKDDVLLAQFKQYALQRSGSITKSPYIGVQKFSSTTHQPPRFNDCTNWKSRAVNLPFNIWHGKYDSKKSNPYSTVYWEPYYRHSSASYSPSEPIGADWDGTRRRAWWNMQPRFEGEISMLNFIYELKDFKDILKYAANFDYTDLRRNAIKVRNIIRRNNSVDPTLPAANLWLLYQFAILPTVSDVLTIHKQLGTLIREKQVEFERLGGDVQTSHFSESVEHASSYSFPYTNNNWYIGTGNRWTSKFTATLSYRYEYKMRSQVDAFLKYWGLQGDFETLWNAMPFSFLVDYFIKIGNAVHAMEADPNVNLMPTQYCESTLDKHENGVFYRSDHRPMVICVDGEKFYYNPPKPVFITGGDTSYYVRRVCEPNKGPALPKFTAPRWAQQANMLALARCFFS